MEHDHLIAMLNRLKLTAIRDQLDSLIDEAGRRELTIREALSLFCEREIARKNERRIEMGVGWECPDLCVSRAVFHRFEPSAR